MALLDAQGEPRWICGFGGASSDVASHVACADAVVFAGVVTGAATIGTLALTPVDQADAVVGRIELDGALVWAAGITGPEAQRPGGLGLRGDGQVLVTLTSAGEATLGERTLVAVGDEDLVLARTRRRGSRPPCSAASATWARSARGRWRCTSRRWRSRGRSLGRWRGPASLRRPRRARRTSRCCAWRSDGDCGSTRWRPWPVMFE